MAKDPAFLFYPGDWQGGTMYFDHQTKGCYIDLMILQFNVGKFTIAQAKQVLSICFDVAWATLQHKFQTDGEFYWNQRLSDEIEKRNNFTKSRRNNALGGKKKENKSEHMQQHMYEHMQQHMEDENRNENIDRVKENKRGSRGKKEKVEKSTIEDSMTFPSEEWRTIWDTWTAYKKAQHGERYKTADTGQIALNDLVLLSENSPENAREILRYSMGKLWKGFFKPKTQVNGNQHNNLFPASGTDEKLGTSAARVNALASWGRTGIKNPGN